MLPAAPPPTQMRAHGDEFGKFGDLARQDPAEPGAASSLRDAARRSSAAVHPAAIASRRAPISSSRLVPDGLDDPAQPDEPVEPRRRRLDLVPPIRRARLSRGPAYPG